MRVPTINIWDLDKKLKVSLHDFETLTGSTHSVDKSFCVYVMIVTVAIVFGSSFIFMLVETFGSTRERRAIDLQWKSRFPLPREER
jgi:hypothetical protein